MKKTFTLSENILKQSLSPEEMDLSMLDGFDMKVDTKVGPSERVLQNIFGYAKALSVIKTKMTGNVNLILN